MAAITTKVDICNLAIGGSGNRNTINNIDTPKSDKEIVCALWYDITRQLLLKTMMPNFALNRIVVSQKTLPAGYVSVYSYCYEYPNRCLKLLGIGNIDDVPGDVVTVENGLIFTNTLYQNGMPIRFIDDITDVPSMSVEFIMTLAAEVRKRISLAISQDQKKKAVAKEEAMEEMSNATALNAQENKPIRRSNSRFRNSRMFNQNQPISGSGKT